MNLILFGRGPSTFNTAIPTGNYDIKGKLQTISFFDNLKSSKVRKFFHSTKKSKNLRITYFLERTEHQNSEGFLSLKVGKTNRKLRGRESLCQTRDSSIMQDVILMKMGFLPHRQHGRLREEFSNN